MRAGPSLLHAGSASETSRHYTKRNRRWKPNIRALAAQWPCEEPDEDEDVQEDEEDDDEDDCEYEEERDEDDGDEE